MVARHFILGSILVALVAAAFVVADHLLSQPGVSEANVRRVRTGMTLPEVEALFGGPPQARVEGGVVLWRGPAGVAYVLVDGQDKVIGAAFIPADRLPARPSHFDAVRDTKGAPR